MKTLSAFTQGVKGGRTKGQNHGYIAVRIGSDKIFSVDNFNGSGQDYKQRDEPVICVYDVEGFDCIFEGTREQLINKLTNKGGK